MINTRDEILIALAGILDVVPPPDVPVFDKAQPVKEMEVDLSKFPNTKKVLEEEDEEGNKKNELDPIPLPKQQVVPPGTVEQVETKQSQWSEPEPEVGRPEWAAKNYPYAYLFGHAPFLGYISDRKNDYITKDVMEDLVTNYPEKYFEWGLRRLESKALDRFGEDWGLRAAEQLVNNNPHYAIILGTIFKDNRYVGHPTLLPQLWSNIFNAEINRSMELPTAKMFPGMLFDRMKSLMKVLKSSHQDFYRDNIEGTAIEGKFNKSNSSPSTQTKPMSKREHWPWGEPEPGTSEWLAEKYPHTYLRGQDLMGSGYVREFQDPKIIQPLMDRLVKEDPIKYFEWNLRRVGDKGGKINLKEWQRPAIKSLIDKSPYEALMFKDKIFGVRGTEDYLDELWDKLVTIGKERERQGLEPFPGRVYNNMVSLAGFISVTNPDFYSSRIQNSKFSTKEFDDRARQMANKRR